MVEGWPDLRQHQPQTAPTPDSTNIAILYSDSGYCFEQAIPLGRVCPSGRVWQIAAGYRYLSKEQVMLLSCYPKSAEEAFETRMNFYAFITASAWGAMLGSLIYCICKRGAFYPGRHDVSELIGVERLGATTRFAIRTRVLLFL